MKKSLLLLISSLLVAASLQAADQRPNVIFVLADDQRYRSMGVTGDPVTQTPNLDQLAREGVLFTNAFVTSPICGPSRANFFTGQWERKNHVGFTNVSNNFVSEEAFNNSWLMQLKKAGYSTAFIGKHHTKIGDRGNTPLKREIDFCYYGEGHLGFYPADKHKVFSNLKHKTQIEGLFEATEAFLKQGAETDYFFANADESVKDCLKRRDPNKPFAAWVNFNLPHAASIGGMGSRPDDPPFYSTLYAEQEDKFVFPEGFPVGITLPDDVFTGKELMPYYRYNKKTLLTTMMSMDRAVHAIDLFMGNLRKLLAEIGADKNTIIVFCSDNGLLLGEHGFGGKTMLYEESVHVPLIFYSPFLPDPLHDRKLGQLVVGQDVSATLLALCGLPVPITYQGVSLLPLIDGKDVPWRQDVFLENLFTDQGYPRQQSVRGERFKYIRYFSKEADRKQYLPDDFKANEQPIYEELFDLENDPDEQHNLAANPEYAPTLKKYQTRCQELVTKLAE